MFIFILKKIIHFGYALVYSSTIWYGGTGKSGGEEWVIERVRRKGREGKKGKRRGKVRDRLWSRGDWTDAINKCQVTTKTKRAPNRGGNNWDG